MLKNLGLEASVRRKRGAISSSKKHGRMHLQYADPGSASERAIGSLGLMLPESISVPCLALTGWLMLEWFRLYECRSNDNDQLGR